jgi:carbamoyl-phosphate synthase large subunit
VKSLNHRILLTGSGGPAGVNVIKSLKESERPPFIVGVDTNEYHIEFARPLVDAVSLVPRCSSKEYVPVLNELIEKYQIDFIHPQPDVEVRAVSENREKLKAKNFLPPKETVRICQDKHASASIWKEHGFPSVESLILRPDHLEDDIHLAFEKFGSKLWIRATEGAGGIGSTPVEKPEVALNWINYWYGRGKDWKFIAQEYLPGDNIAFQSVWKNGEIITSQARERVEYIYPYLAPSGVTGTPVVARTIHNDKLNEMATKAVLSIDKNATGVFCVDIKFDKGGLPMPTEINVGRFFTTSYFFSHAATVYKREYANMPALMLKLAFDEPIPENILKYNALPNNVYWIRHIDCGHFLVPEDKLEKKRF